MEKRVHTYFDGRCGLMKLNLIINLIFILEIFKENFLSGLATETKMIFQRQYFHRIYGC